MGDSKLAGLATYDHIVIKKGIAYLEKSDLCSISSEYFGVSMPPCSSLIQIWFIGIHSRF